MNTKSQIVNTQQSQLQSLKDAQYRTKQIVYSNSQNILSTAISNNRKYIIVGQSKKIGIWKYRTFDLIKSLELENDCYSCKFTEDSQILYVGTYKKLYQFYVNNKFKQVCRLLIHDHYIQNIQCITNTILLSSSWDCTIIKTDVNQRQQLFRILEHYDKIPGLDYNTNLNIIASGSFDYSINLWDGNDGSLIINKLNAHDYTYITQVLFTINNKQLISLDVLTHLIIWYINYRSNQLEQLYLINEIGENIQLVLQKQFIISTDRKFIKVYTIEGEFVREFDHRVGLIINTIQYDTRIAVLIQGRCQLQVCELYLD